MPEASRQRNRIVGARLILRLAKNRARDRGLALDEASWEPSPFEETQAHRETYTLLLVARKKRTRQTFHREDLERIPANGHVRRRIRTILNALLDRLFV